MSIARLLTNAGLFVIEDVHAKKRVTDHPESIRVSYYDTEDILEAVAQASSVYPAPVALVLSTGQVMVLADGGKGGIALQGAEGSLTKEQNETLSVVSDILRNHYGVGMDGEPAPAPDAPDAPLTADQPEDGVAIPAEPESPADGDTEANGEDLA